MHPDPDLLDKQLVRGGSAELLLGVSGVGQLSVVSQSGGDEDIEGVTMVTSVPQMLICLVKDHPCKQIQSQKDQDSEQVQDPLPSTPVDSFC